MSFLVYIGLALALTALFAYLGTAYSKKKKQPSIDGAIEIIISAVGVTGALKLLGFIFTDNFVKLTSSTTPKALFTLSSEDWLFFVLGAIALAWVSIQSIYRRFAEVL